MARIKQDEVSIGATYLDAKSNIKDASSSQGGADNPGTNKGDMVPGIAVPMGYLVTPIDEHWAFGLGVYAPFGLVTDYEHSFQGNGFGNKSKVQVITVQPTVSYAFNDKVSVGFGPTFNKISGSWTPRCLRLAWARKRPRSRAMTPRWALTPVFWCRPGHYSCWRHLPFASGLSPERPYQRFGCAVRPAGRWAAEV